MLISLTLRWFGWLVALLIVFTKAAPPINLEKAPLVLGFTFALLVVMSVYPRFIRPHFPERASTLAPAIWPILDGLVALWSIYATGGWDSPFYHYGVTVVLAPSLRFGLVGALVSSTLFSSFYLLIVKMTAEGFSPAYVGGEQAEPGLVSIPLNPLMIGLYAAFLGEVLKKLHREMKRSERLAAENERARMARDIHDGVSQTLFMLAMSLETGQVLADKENATRTFDHLKNLTPVAQKALMELRNAMFNVEPLADGNQSLQEAVTQLVRDYQSATGQIIEIRLEESFFCPRLTASKLFPMIQEALANACQHSGAQEIELILKGRQVRVKDNGSGFDPSTIKPGRGLRNLESRAEESGFTFLLESEPNGTEVTFGWKEDEE